jgi:L-fuconolactonase
VKEREAVAARGLAFDALVAPRHLTHLLTLLERRPELRVVIDHGAKPAIRDGDSGFDAWATDIARIARESSACCKLSGLVTEAGEVWRTEDLRRYIAHLIECFGAERLMWGSDWPVVALAGGFERWRAATDELLAELSEHERAAILGGTAERFYRLDRS